MLSDSAVLPILGHSCTLHCDGHTHHCSDTHRAEHSPPQTSHGHTPVHRPPRSTRWGTSIPRRNDHIHHHSDTGSDAGSLSHRSLLDILSHSWRRSSLAYTGTARSQGHSWHYYSTHRCVDTHCQTTLPGMWCCIVIRPSRLDSGRPLSGGHISPH